MPELPIFEKAPNGDDRIAVHFHDEDGDDEGFGLRGDGGIQLRAIMLFPTDEVVGRRDQFIDSTLGHLRRYAEVEDAQGPPAWQEPQFENAIRQGSLAGAILENLLRATKYRPEAATMERMLYLLEETPEEYVAANGVKLAQGRAQLLEIWRRYKSVAHLWASYGFWMTHFQHDPLEDARGLIGMLAVADRWLRLGCEHVSGHQGNRGKPLLERSLCWHVPGFAIPLLNEVFADLTDSQAGHCAPQFDLLADFSQDVKEILDRYSRETHRTS